jgi:hypothetical protein
MDEPLEEDAMKNALAVFFSFAALALSGRVAAQSEPDPPTVDGAVVSSGNTSLVIDADDGTKRTFLVDTTTTLPSAGLTAGSRVAVQYQTLDADRAQALKVSLLDPAASGASAPPASRTSPEQSRGPVGLDGPVPLLGLAGFAIVVAGLFAWVFSRSRHQETPHLGLD